MMSEELESHVVSEISSSAGSETGPPRIVAVANPKGGCGKTTTTVNLAAALARGGKRCLVVDLDPQGSASRWLGAISHVRHEVDFLVSSVSLESLARESPIPGVSVVPAPSVFYHADIRTAHLSNPELLLRTKLHELRGWSFVVLDCPASLGVLTKNALVAADDIVAPMEASVLGLVSLVNLYQGVEALEGQLRRRLGRLRVLPCRVDTRTRHTQEVLTKLHERFSGTVFHQFIRNNVRLTESPGHMKSIFDYAPGSAGAEDFEKVAIEFLGAEQAA